MKGTYIGELEELILLTVGILYGKAYAVAVMDEIAKQTGRDLNISAVHAVLTRLEEKGFLKSEMGESTSERGGRRKRIYTITAYGRKVLTAARDFKMGLWNQFPDFATGKLSFGPSS